jgi:regulator of ribosome biosynthesis
MATETMTDASMSDVAPQTSSLAITHTITASTPDRSPVTVTKLTPYIFDLGHLLTIDPNPLPPSAHLLPTTANPSKPSDLLKSTARDGAQTLLNELLSTRPITSTHSGLILSLPPVETQLPRWKPLPKPKPPTKWEAFARKKGIGKYGGAASGGAKLEERRKNMVYDEESGEWVRKWGYKGRNKGGEGPNDWLVELDEKKTKGEQGGEEEGRNVRMEGRKERLERVRRQERKQRSNAKREVKKART